MFQFRRNETNAQSQSDLSKVHVGTIVKSGSFSGCTSIPPASERHTVSDPSAAAIGYSLDTSTTSGADTDDEKKYKRLRMQYRPNRYDLSIFCCNRTPSFKLNKTFNYTLEVRDSSPGKSSINAGEEQSSSLSEQAWDSYQVSNLIKI